jgi:hypothetical protein
MKYYKSVHLCAGVARVRGRAKLEIMANFVGKEDQLGRYE